MSETNLDKAEIEQLWRMIAIPDLMRNGFLAVGQELIKRDAEIDRLTAEKDAAIAQNYCKTCGNTLDGYVPKSELGELYINTEGMRRSARSIKDGQGTPAGSMAKMLIDCCDKIDRLTAENNKMRDGLEIGKSVLVLLEKALAELKTKDEIIKVVLRNVKAGAVTTQWIELYIEQALKENDGN